jgi:hypothetical protein
MSASQGSRGSGATRGGGPQDLVMDVALGGGGPTPEPDSAAGAAAFDASLIMAEPALEVSSLWTQPETASPKIVPKVDTTTATGAATTGDGDGDDDELKVGDGASRALSSRACLNF